MSKVINSYLFPPGSVIFWEYTDGLNNNPLWLAGSQKWLLGSKEVTLTEIGVLCNIRKDDLLLLKLKYGG
jgi:hypothetical protein